MNIPKREQFRVMLSQMAQADPTNHVAHKAVLEDFDRMIGETYRAGLEEGWDEGQSAGISFQAGGDYITNPYRPVGGKP